MTRMNHIRPVLIVFLLFFGFRVAHAQTGEQLSRLKTDLNEILDKWHRDAADGKLDAFIGAMSPNGVYIGTDPSERWTTDEFRNFCKPHFAKGKTWNFRPVSRNLSVSKDSQIAWFDEILDTHMGICRGSGVLQMQEGVWKIEQYVLSAAIPNSLMKPVVKTKWETDSLYLKYLKAGMKNPEQSLELKAIFDKAEMVGTIILFDPQKNEFMGYNPARWEVGYLPASTFKIPNSLIGLETGVIDTSYIFKWDGKKRRMAQWDRDLNLKQAFAVSCVPCYQELASKIGPQQMIEYLGRFNYGSMDVHPENIDLFWLEGKSRITPRQQVEFLQRLYEGKLSVTPSVLAIMKDIMVNEKTETYILRGKTGWAIRNGNNYGWFVGWIETKGRVFYFATLVEPKDQQQVSDFALARKMITMDVLRHLEIIR
ncbi:MAG: class D beta-lactamase [Bacteroidales bacterium]|nr:class D beta-lactamase [Bacteroidales bacterium]HNW74093.1 class D beta-lactamase [Bacteroidales bacterium]